MRLGQLSRKVNAKPSEILLFLKNEFDVELGAHLNTKVVDELSDKVILKFLEKPKPVVKKKIPKETPSNVDDSSTSDSSETDSTIDTLIEVEPKIEKPVKEFEVNQEVDASTILNAELIKAPKVELTGPTVVGKIELPPSLEEQMVEVDGVMISKAEIANRKREERNARKEKSQVGKKRSTSKVRESRQKSEAQIAQIKRDKEADQMAVRLAHREKRIAEKQKKASSEKPKFVAKKVKKKAIIASKTPEKQIVQKPKPTTWHGKLWLWFNT